MYLYWFVDYNMFMYHYTNNEWLLVRWYRYFHEVKESPIQGGEAKLNRVFHLSTNENICTIAQMKNIHYLFSITLKYVFVN